MEKESKKTEEKEEKIENKEPLNTEKTEEKEIITESFVKEEKKLEEKEEKKTEEKESSEETKKTEEESVEKKVEEKEVKIKKTNAFVNAKGLPISTKHSIAVCKFIKGKKIEKAIVDLEKVSLLKKAIPMKGEIPHRKGMMSGRYPKKSAEYFIKLFFRMHWTP